jgi:hypothetical protein
MISLTKTTCLTFPLQKTENISFSHGSLDVTDNGASGGTTRIGIHKFDTDLRDVTGVTGSSEDAIDLGELDGLILKGEMKMLVSGKR